MPRAEYNYERGFTMVKCYCGSVTVIYRDGKQVCFNCLVQERVKSETVCGDHLVSIGECGCQI